MTKGESAPFELGPADGSDAERLTPDEIFHRKLGVGQAEFEQGLEAQGRRTPEQNRDLVKRLREMLPDGE